MVGVAEISAAIGGIKGTVDILQGMNAVGDAVKLNEAKIVLQNAIFEIQAKLLAAQETQTAYLKRISELEAHLAKLKAWDAEKQRYELREISRGTFAYILRSEAQGSEPVHCICANCYEDQERSILQSDGGSWGMATLTCPRCKAAIKALESSPTYPFERSPPTVV